MGIRLDFGGFDLGVHSARRNQAYSWALEFKTDAGVLVDVSGWTFAGQVRATADGPIVATMVVTPAGPYKVVVSIPASVMATVAGQMVASLDRVSPAPRELFHWSLVVTQDVTR